MMKRAGAVLVLALFFIAGGMCLLGTGEEYTETDAAYGAEREAACGHLLRLMGEAQVVYAPVSESCHARRRIQTAVCENAQCGFQTQVILEEAYKAHHWVTRGNRHETDFYGGIVSAHTMFDCCTDCERESVYTVFCDRQTCMGTEERFIFPR